MTHPIEQITFMYGGLAYPEVSDSLISKVLANGTYDVDLFVAWHDTDLDHARRIAGIVHAILNGIEFEIEMWYHPQYPYVGNVHDGNHRLRAYQYLNKEIPLIFRIELDGSSEHDDDLCSRCGDPI